MTRIKIAHVTEATGAGVGRHVIDLVSALDNDPCLDLHLIHSLQRVDARYHHGLTGLQAKIQEVPMQREIKPTADWQGMVAIWQYLRRQGPFDVVHVHSSKAGAIAAVAARLAGVPRIIFTPHAFYSAGLRGRKQKIYQFVERICGFLCHQLIAVSAEEKAYIATNRIVAPSKIKVVPNAITPPDLAVSQIDRQRLRQEWGIAPTTRLIGSIGRLSAQKDPLLFVDLVARRAPRYLDEKYVMVGNGELTAEVQAAIARHQLQDRVLFLGFRADVDAVLAALDIYVMHSRYEAMPYIILEAMGHGLPIVSTKVAGVTEPLQDGGILAEVGDVASLDRALDRLIDPEQRQRLGVANRRRLEKFYTMQPMVDSLLGVYLQSRPLTKPAID